MAQPLIMYSISPFTELDGLFIVYLEAHSNGHLQIIMLYLTADLTVTLRLNYPKFSDSYLY